MNRDSARNERISQLFGAALERPPAERAPFLVEACGEDEALRGEVESLLAFADEDTGPGGLATGGIGARFLSRQTRDRVGPYEIVRTLGSGAMGEVFLASQENPRRQVALKVLRPGSEPGALARFRLEGAALAQMSHENIARVYAAGETDTGEPYIALELVSGDTLTAYADAHRLSIERRLRLFIELCDALEHIHQNGLIHRDLKPTNVVVHESSHGPVPKVIDFGIAKSLVDPLTDGQATVDGAVLGTLEYASPEQLSDSRAVDTRTDLYSAGVILFELLVGTRPFLLDEAGFAGFLERVRHEEPEPPSAALQRDPDAVASIAEQRSTTPARLLAVLRSDLDWIVLKALHKTPAERYASAGALRADVRAFLSGLPVASRPPSAAYRVRKALIRHRNAVIGGATLALVLSGGLLATLWQARVANARLRQLGQVAANLVASVNDIVDVPGAMQAKARLAESATETLEQIGSRSPDPVLTDRLATAYERVGQLRADPYTASLGQTAQGIADLRRALALRTQLYRAHPGPSEALNLMQCSFTLVILLQSAGGGPPDPDSLLRAAIAIGEPIVRADTGATEVARVLSMLDDLRAEYLYPGGHWDSTLVYTQRAYALRRELARREPRNEEVRRLLGQSLGRLAYETMDPREARADAVEALRIHEDYHRAHPFSYRALLDLSFAYRNAAYALRQNAEYDSAIVLYRNGARIRELMAMSDSSDVRSLHLLPDAYDVLVDGFLAGGRPDSALAYAKSALAIREAIAARPNAPPWAGDAIWYSRRTLAHVRAYSHQTASAESLYAVVCASGAASDPVDVLKLWRCDVERLHVALDAGDTATAGIAARSALGRLRDLEQKLRAVDADAVPFGDVAIMSVHLAQLPVLPIEERVKILVRARGLPRLEADPRGLVARVENELGCLLADAGRREEARRTWTGAIRAAIATDPSILAVLRANLEAGPSQRRGRPGLAGDRGAYGRLYLAVFRKWPVWGELPVPAPSLWAAQRVPVSENRLRIQARAKRVSLRTVPSETSSAAAVSSTSIPSTYRYCKASAARECSTANASIASSSSR